MKRTKKLISVLVLVCMLASVVAAMGITAGAATVHVAQALISVPVAGAPLDFTAVVESSSYSVNKSMGTSDGVYWYDKTASKVVSYGEVAIAGHEYGCRIYLKTNSGSTFFSTLIGSINYKSATVSYIQGYSQFSYCAVTQNFDCEDQATVTVDYGEGNGELTVKKDYGTTIQIAAKHDAEGKVFENWKVYDLNTSELVRTETEPMFNYTINRNLKFVASYTSGTIVDTVKISGLSTPANGQKPDYNVTLADGAKYSLYTGSDFSNAVNGVRWYDMTDNKYINSSSTFETGHTYQVNILLVADSGVNFAEQSDIRAYLNSSTSGNAVASLYNKSALKYIAVSHTYTPIPLPVHKTAYINGTNFGISPSSNIPLYKDVIYTIKFVWNWDSSTANGYTYEPRIQVGSQSADITPVHEGGNLYSYTYRYKPSATGSALIAMNLYAVNSNGTTLGAVLASNVLRFNVTELDAGFTDISIDGTSVGVDAGTQTVDANKYLQLEFSWKIPAALYNQGYYTRATCKVSGGTAIEISQSKIKDEGSGKFSYNGLVKDSDGASETYEMVFYLVDPDGTVVSAGLDTAGIKLNFKKATVTNVEVETHGTIDYAVSGRNIVVTNNNVIGAAYIKNGEYQTITTAKSGVTTTLTAPAEATTVFLYVKGDVNGNGKVDTADYVMAKRIVLGTYTASSLAIRAGDIDCNGTIATSDYAKIKRHVLGTFTIE